MPLRLPATKPSAAALPAVPSRMVRTDFADSRRMPCLGLGHFSCASSVSSSPFRFGVRLLGQRESAARAANLRHELEHLRGVYRARCASSSAGSAGPTQDRLDAVFRCPLLSS